MIATSAALWRRIATEDSGWYLILEDDVRLHPALADPEAWDACWRSVPAEAEFVYLGCSSPWLDGAADESTLLRYSTPLNRHCVRVQKTVQGTFAYAITPTAARILLERYLPLSTPVDYFAPTLFPIYALRRMAAPWNRHTPEGFYEARAVWRGNVTVQLHGVVGLYPFPSTIGHGTRHSAAVASETDSSPDGDDPVLAGSTP